MTFSAATLLGTAVDVGRILTILDTTYKYAAITAATSTTVATVTLTGTLSGTGPFANNTIWLSGSVSNGVSPNTTAFSVPFFFAYPNIWLYFPASSPIGIAGAYFCQMASTTVGTCFNNRLANNTMPTVIGSPAAFSGLTPAAYTQTTGSLLPLSSVNVPANSMGVNGAVLMDADFVYADTGNQKNFYFQLGAGPNVGMASGTASTQARFSIRIFNKGVANAQSAITNINSFGTLGSGLPVRFSVDTTATQLLLLEGSLAVATDFIVCEAYSLQEWPN
jgi:hypothetical protein